MIFLKPIKIRRDVTDQTLGRDGYPWGNNQLNWINTPDTSQVRFTVTPSNHQANTFILDLLGSLSNLILI